MYDIEMIIDKVKKEYPDYKVVRISKLNEDYIISVRGQNNERINGIYLEYKNNNLVSRNVTMNDFALIDKYEIVYDAYPGEF